MTSRILVAAAVVLIGSFAHAQDSGTSFFVTSTNPGNGGDFGGLAGADGHCATLAEAAGIKGKVWRAYLSSTAENVRDRIGAGPWTNAKGEVVAANVEELHATTRSTVAETILTGTIS